MRPLHLRGWTVAVKADQRVVAMGAASGVVAMAASVWLLERMMPRPAIADSPGERLAYALRADVFALIPLFAMLATVGNSRFTSEAIDPTRGAESRRMEIDGRVADNTLQQSFVFAVASLALSTLVRSPSWPWYGRARSCSSPHARCSGSATGSTRSIGRLACPPPPT